MKTYGGLEVRVQIQHSFPRQWMEMGGQFHAQATLPRGMSPKFSLDRRLHGHQGWSGRFELITQMTILLYKTKAKTTNVNIPLKYKYCLKYILFFQGLRLPSQTRIYPVNLHLKTSHCRLILSRKTMSSKRFLRNLSRLLRQQMQELLHL